MELPLLLTVQQIKEWGGEWASWAVGGNDLLENMSPIVLESSQVQIKVSASDGKLSY